MAYHRSLLCIALVLLLLREAFANLIQWPSITTKQLTTVFEDSTNVITENCGIPEDILEIEYIKVVPSIISPGKEFTLEAEGKLKEKIEDGAYVEVVIKIGLIKILSKTYDLCETLRNKEGNNIMCPIPAGDIKVSQKFNLPREIPLARFNLVFLAYTADENDIGCLKAIADFQKLPPFRAESSIVTMNYHLYD